MKILRILLAVFAVLVLLFLVRLFTEARKSRTLAVDLGTVEGRLRGCGEAPNCVSSEAEGDHRIDPLPEADWSELVRRVGELEGVEIVEQDGRYLHATARSRLFGFVDDLELLRRDGQVDVRSASRVGYSDLDANRKRVEGLRAALADRGD